MEPIVVTYHQDSRPTLKRPILVEGLPGVGNVGKLAAELVVDQLKAEPFATIHSRYFPPQVIVDDSGIIALVSNRLYLSRQPGPHDLLFLVGDYQGLTPEGQYELADCVLALAKGLGVERVYTLGGYGIGRMVEEPKVLGATTSAALVAEMRAAGVLFPEGEPGSGIVGASGLLLGLGRMRAIEGVCLMGQTSGYFVDPKSAGALLTILCPLLGITVDLADLEAKAAQIDVITSRIREIEGGETSQRSREDLHYIG